MDMVLCYTARKEAVEMFAVLFLAVGAFVVGWLIMSSINDTRSVFGWSVRTFGVTPTRIGIGVIIALIFAFLVRFFS